MTKAAATKLIPPAIPPIKKMKRTAQIRIIAIAIKNTMRRNLFLVVTRLRIDLSSQSISQRLLEGGFR